VSSVGSLLLLCSEREYSSRKWEQRYIAPHIVKMWMWLCSGRVGYNSSISIGLQYAGEPRRSRIKEHEKRLQDDGTVDILGYTTAAKVLYSAGEL
jgi:hypothetical protein